MVKIINVIGREILDSRGNPTVEAEIYLDNGIVTRASVPSGASIGSKEALELRDNDNRYHGKGVRKAVNNINTIIRETIINEELDQLKLDKILINLDGTENKTNLGANAMLAVSLASIKAEAKIEDKELYAYLSSGKVSMPIPFVNIINGGAHADNNLDIQEFMIVPVVKTIKERVRVSSEIFHKYWKIFRNSYKTRFKYTYQHLYNELYRGYINERNIMEVDGCRKQWNEAALVSKKKLRSELYFKHDISYRIYRSWEDFEDYNLQNIRKINKENF